MPLKVGDLEYSDGLIGITEEDLATIGAAQLASDNRRSLRSQLNRVEVSEESAARKLERGEDHDQGGGLIFPKPILHALVR